MRPFRLKSIPTIDISREDTEMSQEHTWLQNPGRGNGGAVEMARCRRVAGALEGGTGECGHAKERPRTWESS